MDNQYAHLHLASFWMEFDLAIIEDTPSARIVISESDPLLNSVS